MSHCISKAARVYNTICQFCSLIGLVSSRTDMFVNTRDGIFNMPDRFCYVVIQFRNMAGGCVTMQVHFGTLKIDFATLEVVL